EGMKAIEVVVASRIDRWKLTDSPFFADLVRAQALTPTDADMALAKCRQILEGCLTSLYSRTIGSPGTRKLEELIRDLGRHKALPRKVFALCEVVRELGNVGAHPIYDDELLTYTVVSLESVSSVTRCVLGAPCPRT